MSEQDDTVAAGAVDVAWNIATVKQQVQDQLGDERLNGTSWTPFVKQVAGFLHGSRVPDPLVGLVLVWVLVFDVMMKQIQV